MLCNPILRQPAVCHTLDSRRAHRMISHDTQCWPPAFRLTGCLRKANLNFKTSFNLVLIGRKSPFPPVEVQCALSQRYAGENAEDMPHAANSNGTTKTRSFVGGTHRVA